MPAFSWQWECSFFICLCCNLVQWSWKLQKYSLLIKYEEHNCTPQPASYCSLHIADMHTNRSRIGWPNIGCTMLIFAPFLYKKLFAPNHSVMWVQMEESRFQLAWWGCPTKFSRWLRWASNFASGKKNNTNVVL